MDDLTNAEKKLISSLYKFYLEKQPALSPAKANRYGNSTNLISDLSLDLDIDESSDLCWSLFRAGYIECTPGDNLACNIKLTGKTIIYFENKFKNGIMDVVKFISSFR